MDIIIGILEEGFVYAIMALGVYITYKILDFPDLTVDSSFPLGAAIVAVGITGRMNPWLTLVLAFVAGGIAGMVTGLVHVKCGVRDLLSGIIVMTGLYSVNLFIAGSANVPIFQYDNIFRGGVMDTLPETISPYVTTIIALVILLVMKFLLDFYLSTRSGYLLRAVGDNANVVTSLAKDSGNVKILGLTIANALVALAGGVLCQKQRSFDIGMGTGTIVMGLAIVIIGTSLLKNVSFVKPTTAVIVGSVIYKACMALALQLHMPTESMKLINAVLFLIILMVSRDRKKKLKLATTGTAPAGEQTNKGGDGQ